MSYLLNGGAIKAPQDMQESNSTQYAQQRVLSGAVGRDYFGTNKKMWTLKYDTIQKADFDVINTAYQAYLTTGTPLAWQVTETSYPVAATTVHVDLPDRDFSVKGGSYLSDFTLTLIEA